MMNRWKLFCKYAVLAAAGGSAYVLFELLTRGRSHWTMFVLGGLCFVLIGLLNELIPWEMPLLLQGAIGSCIVTALEFATGCIVNLWLGWGVWDYSGLPLNVLGQICLPFSLLWILVAILAVLLDDWLRYCCFGEDRPRYTLFRWRKKDD